MSSFKFISIEKKENIFIITLQKPPENRLNVAACQELIQAYRHVEKEIGKDSEGRSYTFLHHEPKTKFIAGAVILKGSDAKFFTTGLDLDERDENPFASSDGFYPLLATILDFPFPTIALITGHVMGGACLLTLAHDYRIMNSTRGYWQMPPVNAGLHHDGMGVSVTTIIDYATIVDQIYQSLIRAKLGPQVRRKVLLEAHRYTGVEALEDGIVDAVAPPEKMLDVALGLAKKWQSKAKMGVYGVLRNELVGEATRAYQMNSYVHHRETSREPKVKL